jgi:aminomethyltransferase
MNTPTLTALPDPFPDAGPEAATGVPPGIPAGRMPGIASGEPTLFQRPLRMSPFAPRANTWMETDSFAPWLGVSMPDVYCSPETEYFAIRNAASVYDISPMLKMRITGPDAERYLNRLVTADVRRQKPGKVAYTVWCDEHGHVLDEGTLFRFGPHDFRLCPGERALDWFLDAALGHDVSIVDETEDFAALAVQGPTTFAVLRQLGLVARTTPLEALRPNNFADYELAGVPLMVSRTGFTGDLGYELWIAPEHALMLWDRLFHAGRSRGIRPVGNGALEMARIEAGHLMPEMEFTSAAHTIRMGSESTPFELGLDFCVAMDKGHFNGRRALVKALAAGPRRKLVGLEIEGNKPAHDALIYADKAGNQQIGAVTSALWSPTCKRNLALARLDAPYFNSADAFWVDIYLHRELQWERRTARAWIVERPFYAPERRLLTPPNER